MNDSNQATSEPLIEVSGVTRRYGTLTALDNVSLQVPAAVKLGLAAVAGRIGLRRNSFQLPTLLWAAALWIGFVSAVAAFLIWLLPNTPVVSYSIPSVTLLAVPGIGIALAPVALDWNRHGA